MGTPARVRRRLAAALTAAVLVLAGCATTTEGLGTVGPADLAIAGYSGSTFDQQARNALSDVIGFWTLNYPKIDNGKALPQLKGKLYSVDGAEVFQTHKAPPSAQSNGCLQRKLSFIIDNAAYCQLDDSIIWDRATTHLLPVLADDYGPTLTALVFAHEFGHAIQHRLGIDSGQGGLQTIDIESQADCAAGAFAAAAMNGGSPHFQVTAADLDKALEGYLLIRDSTPDSPADISHGNGFDRLTALQEGIQKGVTYCYGSTFFKDRSFTERGYASDRDYQQGGNEAIGSLLAGTGIAQDLNRFWTLAGRTVSKTLQPVKLAQADHPACGASSSTSEFGYCPDDNTVYYSTSFANQAYNSLTALDIDKATATVSVARNQPADYALGELISIAWGLAARHQFFNGSITDQAALIAGVCYSGAYAKDINRESNDDAHPYVLSPPDMDEATSAVLDLVPMDEAFSDRATTGLQRVQAFVKGYRGGLGACS